LWLDEEAKVAGYTKGNTNPKHRHLQCELPSGNKFSIGNGFTEYEHTHPPPVGSIITFKFQEYTTLGTPRFPSFIRVRQDVTWDDVVKSWKSKSWNEKHVQSQNRKANLFWTTLPLFAGHDDSPAALSSSTMSIQVEEKDDSTTKRVCKYGATCYRKNAEHLKLYFHPETPNTAPASNSSTDIRASNDTINISSINYSSDNPGDSSYPDVHQNDDNELMSMPKTEWLSILNRLAFLEQAVQQMENQSSHDINKDNNTAGSSNKRTYSQLTAPFNIQHKKHKTS